MSLKFITKTTSEIEQGNRGKFTGQKRGINSPLKVPRFQICAYDV